MGVPVDFRAGKSENRKAGGGQRAIPFLIALRLLLCPFVELVAVDLNCDLERFGLKQEIESVVFV